MYFDHDPISGRLWKRGDTAIASRPCCASAQVRPACQRLKP